MQRHLDRHSCPYCNQPIDNVADDLMELNVSGGERWILLTLNTALGEFFPAQQISRGSSKESLRVKISRLRKALKNAKLPYELLHERKRGYRLVKTDEQNSLPSGTNGEHSAPATMEREV